MRVEDPPAVVLADPRRRGIGETRDRVAPRDELTPSGDGPRPLVDAARAHRPAREPVVNRSERPGARHRHPLRLVPSAAAVADGPRSLTSAARRERGRRADGVLRTRPRHESHEFLRSFALVLGVAALTTVLFQRLHQPVVLGYLIAGMIIGPHLPIPLVADKEVVQTLSELGVILLMFSLGLEFSFTRLARVGPAPGITAVIECGLMMWLGYLTGRAIGWTETESAFAGALVAVSSTTIIAKTFAEQGVTGRLRDFVVGDRKSVV